MEYVNAKERFEVHDSIMIGNTKSIAGKPGWYDSFSSFAASQKHSLFKQRAISDVGLAYNNMDTRDQMPFAFELTSIGISFAAPLGITGEEFDPVTPANDNNLIGPIWCNDVPRLIGFRLKVRQDEKLLHCCELAPEGAGSVGAMGVAAGGGALNVMTNITQSEPDLDNRWPFPEPIGIPRAASFSVELELSSYCVEMLRTWPQLNDYYFGPIEQQVRVPSVASIRCSLIGNRFVQQRNELHYG